MKWWITEDCLIFPHHFGLTKQCYTMMLFTYNLSRNINSLIKFVLNSYREWEILGNKTKSKCSPQINGRREPVSVYPYQILTVHTWNIIVVSLSRKWLLCFSPMTILHQWLFLNININLPLIVNGWCIFLLILKSKIIFWGFFFGLVPHCLQI